VAVNKQHSQGVGLDLFSQTKGTYQVTDPAASLSMSLPLGDQIVNGSLQISVERHGAPLVSGSIAIDPSLSLNDLVQSINTDPFLGGYLNASVEDNSLKIEQIMRLTPLALPGTTARPLPPWVSTLFSPAIKPIL
jgi:hypothetical protein